MIELRAVSYTYGSPQDGREALKEVSATVAPGEIVALLGHNGSGKSTLGLIAAGLALPTKGEVLVGGIPTHDAERAWELRSAVGIVFQNPDNQIVGTIVEEDVAFGPENLGVPSAELRRRVDDALGVVGLTGLERREPHLLSEGQKQRLAIAGALALGTRYLVLDEPTSMLDPEGRAGVLSTLRSLKSSGHGILHITHSVAEAAEADRVVVLSGGCVVFQGSLVELLADSALMERAGLSVPPIHRLVVALDRLGVSVPPASMNAESIVEAVCPSAV